MRSLSALLPSRAVVAIEPTTISDSMEIITESDPIEAIPISAPEPALVPSEHVSIEPQTTFPSFFQFISRFGSLAFVVMLLVASILYLAAQAILAPIYAPLVIHVSHSRYYADAWIYSVNRYSVVSLLSADTSGPPNAQCSWTPSAQCS